MRYPTLVLLSVVVALSACKPHEPPPLSEILPSRLRADQTSEALPGQVAAGFDASYETRWECRWDREAKAWNLPDVMVIGGEAIAADERTRLSGVVTKAPEGEGGSGTEHGPPAGALELTGERSDQNGLWSRMSMAGPVYRDRPSILHGYWKGATCSAELVPRSRGIAGAPR